MKPPLLLLGFSLAANAVLLALWWPGSATVAGTTTIATPPNAAVRPPAPSGAGGARLSLGDAAWERKLRAALAAGDHSAIRQLMTATGLPEATARALLRALIFQPYEDRRREIYAAKLAAGKPFWQRPMGNDGLTPAERTELRQLQRAAREQSRLYAGPEETALASARRYDFLPPNKAAQLADVNRDYDELQMELIQEVQRFRLPEDETRFQLLQAERERDLAALLTPEERQRYDLQESPTAQRLRATLAHFNATEEEFRKIYALQRAFDERFAIAPFAVLTGGNATPSTDGRSRAEAEKALQAELQQALGPTRFAEYERAQWADYKQLQAAAQRYSLPASALDLAWAARTQVLAISAQVEQDASLAASARQASLSAAANQARAAVVAALGPTVGADYLKNAMMWLTQMERGQPVSVQQANGQGVLITTVAGPGGSTVTTIRSSPSPAPTPKGNG